MEENFHHYPWLEREYLINLETGLCFSNRDSVVPPPPTPDWVVPLADLTPEEAGQVLPLFIAWMTHQMERIFLRVLEGDPEHLKVLGLIETLMDAEDDEGPEAVHA